MKFNINVVNIQQSMRKYMTVEKLRFLLYPTGLTDQDRQTIRKDDAGVIWL
jgi:hypothetical protein